MHTMRKTTWLAGVALASGLACLATSAAAPPSELQGAMDRGDAPAVARLLPRSAEVSFPGRPQLKAGASDASTRFEELKACGFYPEENRLECTIEIKQKSGYGGQIGQLGSMEHVYFCVAVLNSSFIGWYPLGIGSVQMHDESAGGSPPWQYAVYRDFNPLGQVRMVDNAAHTSVTTQTMGQTFVVKAILSYWMPVDNCNAPDPVWGNTLTFAVRADPIR